MTLVRLTRGWQFREALVVLALALLSLVLWRVAWVWVLFYPFHLFGTFVHEISHGLAAILSGGEFRRFVVRPDLSGTAWSTGGAGWCITSAGYLGSTLFGGLLLIITARGVPARAVLVVLGGTLVLFCLLFVRNLFGIATGLLLAASLIAAGLYLQRLLAYWLLLFFAVQSMLDALNSLFDLVRASSNGHLHNDAAIMQRTTGVPALFWALLWSIIAIGMLLLAFMLAYRRGTPPGRSQAEAALRAAEHRSQT